MDKHKSHRISRANSEDRYQQWYQTYLRARFRRISDRLKGSLVNTPSPQSLKTPAEHFLKCLEAIAEVLSQKPYVALAQVVDFLCENSLATTDDAMQPAIGQAVFIAIGMVTLLYCPSLQPTTGSLELVSDENTSPETFQQDSHDVESAINQPVVTILQKFFSHSGPISCMHMHSNVHTQVSGAPILLVSANLNYYTLKTLVGITLIMTESALEHLELDMSSNKLKIFCFPSFCALACRTSPPFFQATLPSSAEMERKQDTYLSRYLAPYRGFLRA